MWSILHITNIDGHGNKVFRFILGNIFDHVIISMKITINVIAYGLKHVIPLTILIKHAFSHTLEKLKQKKNKTKLS